MIRQPDGGSAGADGISLLLQQRGIGSRHLDGFHTRGIAQNEAEIGRADHSLQEQRGRLRFFTEDPGHVGACIQQHANIEDHVTMVGKELDGLLPAIFVDPELALLQLAGQAFLVIADGEVHRDQIYLATDDAFLATRFCPAFFLCENPFR